MTMVNEVKELQKHGYLVEAINSPYQYRVECVLDIYVTNKRFHNIADQRRGEYPSRKFKEFEKFILGQIAAADKILDQYVAEHPGAFGDGNIECYECGQWYPEQLGKDGCPQCGQRKVNRTARNLEKPWYTRYSR